MHSPLTPGSIIWRVPRGDSEPGTSTAKHGELSARSVLRAMSYGFAMLSPCWSRVHLRGKGIVESMMTVLLWQ
jgi:hypothetical protein